MSKYSIKQTLELLVALEILAVAGKKITQDGINLSSLQHLMALSSDLDKIVDGFKDVNEIPKELGDLDEAEVMQIIAKLYSISKAISEA